MTAVANSAYTPLVLTAANKVSNQPPYNTFTAQLNGNIDLTGMTVGVASISLFYSWYTISSAAPYGPNNTFSFVWPPDGLTYVVTLPDGGYSIADIQAYLEYFCQVNSTYLIDNLDNPVYYMTWAENASAYGVQWNSTPLPTALPAGWSIPSGAAWTLPGDNSGDGPTLDITNAAFGKIVGFQTGLYPPVGFPAAPYSALSTFTPEVSPQNAVLLSADFSVNYMSNTPSVIYTFAPSGVTFGGIIQVNPPEILFVDCVNGQRQSVTIRLFDQNYNALGVLDPEVTVLLVFRPKRAVNHGK